MQKWQSWDQAQAFERPPPALLMLLEKSKPAHPAGPCRCLKSVDEASTRRLVERHRKRFVFGAIGAADLADAAQVVLSGLAVALLELPESVILPGANMVRIGLERALVPDLRDLVVAELAVGIADQIGDIGTVVTAERLQLLDRRGVVVSIVDRGIGGAIAISESGLFNARAGFARLLFLLRRRRWIVVGRCVDGGSDGSCRERERQHCESQKPDR